MAAGGETFAVRMRDHSMAPRFNAGEWLFVDPDEPAVPGRFVAIEDPAGGGRTVREMAMVGGRRVLRALDADWPEIVVNGDNETMILGTVVFWGGLP